MPAWTEYRDDNDSAYSAGDILAILASGTYPDGSPFSMNVGSGDAFGRLRVSDPETLFDVSHQYDEQPLLIEKTLTGGGTATHNPAHSYTEEPSQAQASAAQAQAPSTTT